VDYLEYFLVSKFSINRTEAQGSDVNSTFGGDFNKLDNRLNSKAWINHPGLPMPGCEFILGTILGGLIHANQTFDHFHTPKSFRDQNASVRIR